MESENFLAYIALNNALIENELPDEPINDDGVQAVIKLLESMDKESFSLSIQNLAGAVFEGQHRLNNFRKIMAAGGYDENGMPKLASRFVNCLDPRFDPRL